MKSIVSIIQNQSTARIMIFFMSVLLIGGITAPLATAAVTGWELAPEDPEVGDNIEIRGSADPNEEMNVLVSFEKEVSVSDGKYEYLLEGVIIPNGLNNRFTVEARRAEDLNVRLKMLLWLTKSAEASDGVAVVSQAHVPPGTYSVRVDGKAEGPNVKLKITALQTIKADSDGKFSYEYGTESVPAGDFEINVGDIEKQVNLKPAGASYEPQPVLTVTEVPTSKDAENGRAPEENLSGKKALEEEKALNGEKSKNESSLSEKSDQNVLLENGSKDTLLEGNGSKTADPGQKSSGSGVLYLFAGVILGVITIFYYLRSTRP